jgi:hypothetical protein
MKTVPQNANDFIQAIIALPNPLLKQRSLFRIKWTAEAGYSITAKVMEKGAIHSGYSEARIRGAKRGIDSHGSKIKYCPYPQIRW